MEDAYWHDELGIIDPDELASLECVRSFDMGQRTVEEFYVDIAIEACELVGATFLRLCGLYWDCWSGDVFTLLACTYRMAPTSESGGHFRCEDLDDLDALAFDVDYHYIPALSDAGYIVEESSDAGMTWIYRKVAS